MPFKKVLSSSPGSMDWNKEFQADGMPYIDHHGAEKSAWAKLASGCCVAENIVRCYCKNHLGPLKISEFLVKKYGITVKINYETLAIEQV